MFKWFYRFGVVIILISLFLLGVNWYVSKYAENDVYDSIDDLPEVRVGLVLGTSNRVSDGRPNIFFLRRIDAGVELYENGKVEKLLLSGDNSTLEYNEPEMMKEAFIEAGIPEEDLVLDYAGFRTLDSVVRAAEVFGVEEMIVVSQKFHTERAIFIARNIGIDAYGYNADSPGFEMAPRVFVREVFARVYLVWDLFINDTEPKFLGDEIEV